MSSDPFGLREGSQRKLSRPMLMLKNVGMFLLALVATMMVATLFKVATASATGDKENARYFLQATVALRPGEILSPENATWRSTVGRKTANLLTADNKKSDRFWGSQITAPVRAGQPVQSSGVLTVSAADQGVRVPPGMVGFVLSGDELAATAELLRMGSRVNVIAVAGGPRKELSPSVATLIQSARVLHVRGGSKRVRGMDPSVTIAVTPEDAEDLAAWRQNGSLVLALAGDGFQDPSVLGQWRTILEDDVQTSEAEDTVEYSAAEAAAPQPTGPTVSVISPSGTQQREVK